MTLIIHASRVDHAVMTVSWFMTGNRRAAMMLAHRAMLTRALRVVDKHLYGEGV